MKDLLELFGFVLAEEQGGASLQFEEAEDEEPEIVITDRLEEEPDEDENLPEGYRGYSKEDLVKILTEREQQYSQQDTTAAALERSIASLGEKLGNGGGSRDQSQSQPQAPSQEEIAKWKEEFNTKFYDNPADHLEQFLVQKLAPEFQRLAKAQEQIGMKELERDPSRADTYRKYKDEVEKELERMSPQERYANPQAITEAHDRVVARHLNEVMDEQVQKAVEKAMAEYGQQKPQPKPPHSEVGGTPSVGAAPKRKQVRLTPREARWADNKGLSHIKAAEVLERNPGIRTQLNA